MNTEESQIDVKDIDHLGIIAGIMDEMDLVNLIDGLIPPHPLEKISVGVGVKAMILNCMGFLTSPFYLFSRFFEGKAVENLLGEGIEANHLNESRLGRILDEIYKYGLSKLFVAIAMAAVKIFGVTITSVHADTTSISVEGEYRTEKEQDVEVAEEVAGEVKPEEAGEEELKPIRINYGYSRDHRPDLKQFTMGLVTNGEAGIPLMVTVGDGNESDQKHLQRIMKEFVSLWDVDKMNFLVMDSAGYTPENLQSEWGGMNWIVRVPATIKDAKENLQTSDEQVFIEDEKDVRYKIASVNSEYGGVNQRWFVVQSEPRRESDLQKLIENIVKENEKKTKEFSQTYKKGFACEADALEAAKQFASKLKFHQIETIEITSKPCYNRPGEPKVGQEPQGYIYYPRITLQASDTLIQPYKNQAGRFILGTNCLDETMLSPSQALSLYKEQQGTERGFRFIKDPLFFASSTFLKSARRIMAVAFIIALALLVYSLGQQRLRNALQQAQASLPNQKGKPTARPTLRWILQCFQSIHLVCIRGVKSLIKITQAQRSILKFLGSHCQKYYCLS